MRKNKGITLIALVITIIVLIILAGISLNIIFRNGGLVEKTKQGDNTRGYIRGFDDYIKYRENYELRQKSCQELKKEITKDVKIKKKKL